MITKTEYDGSELASGEALVVETMSGNAYTLKVVDTDGTMRISDKRGLLVDGKLIGASFTGGPTFVRPGAIIKGCSMVLCLNDGRGELITSAIIHLHEVGGKQIF